MCGVLGKLEVWSSISTSTRSYNLSSELVKGKNQFYTRRSQQGVDQRSTTQTAKNTSGMYCAGQPKTVAWQMTMLFPKP